MSLKQSHENKTLFLIETDKFHFAVSRYSEDVLIFEAKGVAEPKDIQEIFENLTKILRGLKDQHIVAEVADFNSFPWSERRFVFDSVEQWFNSGLVKHVHLVSPSSFVRMIAFLVGKFYKRIAHSYHQSMDEAIKDSLNSEKDRVDGALNEIREALEQKQSNTQLEILESFEDNDLGKEKAQLNSLIIAPNILFMKYDGQLNLDGIKRMYERVHSCQKYFPRMHYVVDLRNLTGFSNKARKLFTERIEEFDRIYLSKHYLIPSSFRPLYKIFTFLYPNYDRTTQLIKSVEECILELKMGQAVQVQTPSVGLDADEVFKKDELIGLTKESLINFIEEYHHQEEAFKKDVDKKLNQVYGILSQISWNQSFDQHSLPELPENDLFYDTFQAVNILQEDMHQMVSHLTSANKELEQKINERTEEIRKKESNLRSLIQHYRSPIWMVDKDFRIMEYNAVFAAGAKLVYNIELCRGLAILEMMPKEHASLWRTRYLKALQGETASYQHSQEVNGKMEYYDTIVYPMYDQESINGVGVITNDITEIESSKINAEKQNTQLTKLNYELDTFMYRSTHDMRAPVATIKGLINLALSEEQIEEKNRCLEFMSKSVNRMDLFIKEIADITKNSKFELDPVEINFDQVINELLEELVQGQPYTEVQITHSIAGAERFVSDKFRLKTILKNIISNAIKYSKHEQDSFVKIQIQLLDGHSVILIEDNGQGIRKGELDKIFDMFHRSNEKSEGTGLGLFIVKELLEKLKGEISVQSKFGEGTSFKLEIPSLN